MINNRWLIFLSDKRRWLVLFVLTYLVSWYWLPEQVPLYYSLVLKQDQLASQYTLLMIPLLVMFFFLVGQKWLEKLALENTNMLTLIKAFLVVLASFSYLVFLKIIILVI